MVSWQDFRNLSQRWWKEVASGMVFQWMIIIRSDLPQHQCSLVVFSKDKNCRKFVPITEFEIFAYSQSVFWWQHLVCLRVYVRLRYITYIFFLERYKEQTVLLKSLNNICFCLSAVSFSILHTFLYHKWTMRLENVTVFLIHLFWPSCWISNCEVF